MSESTPSLSLRRFRLFRMRPVYRVTVLFALIGIYSAAGQARERASPFLRIYHLDVGQGDATLIIGTNGKTLLVDAGETIGAVDHILDMMRLLGIDKIDYLVVTHYDADHYKGVIRILETEAGERTQVFDRGDPESEKKSGQITYRKYKALFPENPDPSGLRSRWTVQPGPFPAIRPDGGQSASPSFSLSRDRAEVLVRCIAVNGKVVGTRWDETGELAEENANSIALHIRYGDFDYFIGGDLTSDVETKAGLHTGDIDVLRVNHHGSLTSSDEVFLKAIKAEVAIISVGDPGTRATTYELPKVEVQKRLIKHLSEGGGDLFQTNHGWRGRRAPSLVDGDVQNVHVAIAGGDVVLITDGYFYTVNGKTYRVDGN